MNQRSSLLFTIIIALFFIVTSCNLDTNKSEKPVWKELTIKKNEITLYIYATSDSAFYIQTFQNYDKKRNKDVNSGHVVFDTKTRKELFNLAEEVILKPVLSYQTMSCYAGDYLSISLIDGSTKVSCSYNSVSNWGKISPQLNQIKSIIRTKLRGL